MADTVLAVLDMMFQFVRVRQQWHLNKSRLTESSLKWMAFAYQFQGALNHGLHKRIPGSVSYKKRKKNLADTFFLVCTYRFDSALAEFHGNALRG